jgi:hemoglobin-like flavoprotein
VGAGASQHIRIIRVFLPVSLYRCTYIEKHIIDNKFPQRSSPSVLQVHQFYKSMFYNMPGLEPVQDVYDNERGDQGQKVMTS